jgi:hypothetical protein
MPISYIPWWKISNEFSTMIITLFDTVWWKNSLSEIGRGLKKFWDLEYKPYPVDPVNPVLSAVALNALEFRQDQQDGKCW